MEDFEDIFCEKCEEIIEDDIYSYHSMTLCEDCLFEIFLKENNFDKRLTQDEMDDDDYFLWDRFRESHLEN